MNSYSSYQSDDATINSHQNELRSRLKRTVTSFLLNDLGAGSPLGELGAGNSLGELDARNPLGELGAGNPLRVSGCGNLAG